MNQKGDFRKVQNVLQYNDKNKDKKKQSDGEDDDDCEHELFVFTKHKKSPKPSKINNQWTNGKDSSSLKFFEEDFENLVEEEEEEDVEVGSRNVNVAMWLEYRFKIYNDRLKDVNRIVVVLLFIILGIILYVCLLTQQISELQSYHAEDDHYIP